MATQAQPSPSKVQVQQLHSEAILQRLAGTAENLESIRLRLSGHKDHLYGPVPNKEVTPITGPSNSFMEKVNQGFDVCTQRIDEIFGLLEAIEKF